jgi:hypothetical protein
MAVRQFMMLVVIATTAAQCSVDEDCTLESDPPGDRCILGECGISLAAKQSDPKDTATFGEWTFNEKTDSNEKTDAKKVDPCSKHDLEACDRAAEGEQGCTWRQGAIGGDCYSPAFDASDSKCPTTATKTKTPASIRTIDLPSWLKERMWWALPSKWRWCSEWRWWKAAFGFCSYGRQEKKSRGNSLTCASEKDCADCTLSCFQIICGCECTTSSKIPNYLKTPEQCQDAKEVNQQILNTLGGFDDLESGCNFLLSTLTDGGIPGEQVGNGENGDCARVGPAIVALSQSEDGYAFPTDESDNRRLDTPDVNADAATCTNPWGGFPEYEYIGDQIDGTALIIQGTGVGPTPGEIVEGTGVGPIPVKNGMAWSKIETLQASLRVPGSLFKVIQQTGPEPEE